MRKIIFLLPVLLLLLSGCSTNTPAVNSPTPQPTHTALGYFNSVMVMVQGHKYKVGERTDQLQSQDSSTGAFGSNPVTYVLIENSSKDYVYKKELFDTDGFSSLMSIWRQHEPSFSSLAVLEKQLNADVVTSDKSS